MHNHGSKKCMDLNGKVKRKIKAQSVHKRKIYIRYLSFIHRSFKIIVRILLCEGGYLVCLVLSNEDKLFCMKFDNLWILFTSKIS